jgi:hypothetical protein
MEMQRVQSIPKEASKVKEHDFRLFMLALLSLSMATFLLFHFGCIWVYGKFYISEPRQWLLSLETILIFNILAFSAYCAVEQLKGIK